MESKKRIALIAHDNKKFELVEWTLKHKAIISNHELFATGTTGTLVEEALKQPVTKFQSGPLGGDQQIGGGCCGQGRAEISHTVGVGADAGRAEKRPAFGHVGGIPVWRGEKFQPI